MIKTGYEIVQWFENQKTFPAQFYFRLGSYETEKEAVEQMRSLIYQHRWLPENLKVIKTCVLGENIKQVKQTSEDEDIDEEE